MSIKIVAQLHPFKTDLTIIQRNAAPLAELYASLGVPTDIKIARMMIDDRIATDFSEVPKDGSTVYIKVVPEGNNKNAGKGMGWVGAIMIVAGASMVWFGPTSGLGVMLIGSGIGLLSGGVALYNMQIPGIGGNSDDIGIEQAPSIRGARNQANQWGPVPILLGKHLLYPSIAATPYTSVAGDMAGNLAGDAVDNSQYLTMLYCAGYKNMSIDYSTVKIGDSKITDLSYTKNITSIRNGSDPWIWLEVIQNGAASAIFPKVCKDTQLNLVIEHDQPVVRTTVDKTTKIIVDLRLPSGLGKYNKKGKLESTTLQYKVEYKPTGHPDSEYSYISMTDPFTPGPTTIGDQRLQTIQWRLEKTVTSGQYEVRVTRVTADATDTRTIDQFQWVSLKSVLDDRPVRAERAAQLTIIALRVKATNLVKGYVDQLNFVAQSVLPVYSGSGSGASSWAGTAATSNPAACFKYALQGAINTVPLANSLIDWASLEPWYQWCDVHNYTCNAYIADEITLRQLLYQIASTARAEFTKVNNKIGVVQDIARTSHVQLFTPRNTWDFEATKMFTDIPEALEMQFISAPAGYVDDQRTVYDVTGGYGDGTGGTTEAKKKQTVKLWGVTDPAQAYRIGKYMYAVTRLRPWIYSFNVDIEYLLAGRGSLVRLAHDVAMRGQVQGRINGRIMEGSDVAGFVLDELVTMESGNSYVIRIRKKDNSSVLLPVTTRAGSSREVYLQSAILTSTAPDTEDLFAFGISGQETDDVIITKVEPLDEKSAKITAVDYSPEIFGVDDPAYVIPTYDPKVTVGGIMDKGTSDFNPSPVSATIEDLNNVLNLLYDGVPEYMPADLASLTVTAVENGLSLEPVIVQEGAVSGIKCHYQIKRGNADWVDIPAYNSFYTFIRSVDGYPEKATLDTWFIRAKAVNQYGNESPSWRTSAIDTTGYGTWLVQPPVITERTNKRSLHIHLEQPTGQREIYGNVRYQIQISRYDDMDGATRLWYKPNLSSAADPYGAETNYKVDTDPAPDPAYVVATADFSQTVPLQGQSATPAAPGDTVYYYRVLAFNEAGCAMHEVEGVSVPYYAETNQMTARATGARDVVLARLGDGSQHPDALTAKNIYAENLTAIAGTFAQVQGDAETSDSYWKGMDTDNPEFRVGNDHNLEEQDSEEAEYIHYKDGSLAMRLKNFIVTVRETTIKGTLTLYNAAKDFRNLVSSAGMTFQKKVTDWLNPVDVAQISADEKSNLVITNNPSALSVEQIAPPSSTIKIHHLDSSLNDTDGNNTESLVAASGGCGATAEPVLARLKAYFDGKLTKAGVVAKSTPAYNAAAYSGLTVLGVCNGTVAGYTVNGNIYTFKTVNIKTGDVLTSFDWTLPASDSVVTHTFHKAEAFWTGTAFIFGISRYSASTTIGSRYYFQFYSEDGTGIFYGTTGMQMGYAYGTCFGVSYSGLSIEVQSFNPTTNAMNNYTFTITGNPYATQIEAMLVSGWMIMLKCNNTNFSTHPYLYAVSYTCSGALVTNIYPGLAFIDSWTDYGAETGYLHAIGNGVRYLFKNTDLMNPVQIDTAYYPIRNGADDNTLYLYKPGDNGIYTLVDGVYTKLGTAAASNLYLRRLDNDRLYCQGDNTVYFFPAYNQSLVAEKHYAFWFKGGRIRFGKVTIPCDANNWLYCRLTASGTTVSWYIVKNELINDELDVFASGSSNLANYGLEEDNEYLDFVLEGAVEEFTSDTADISTAVMKKMVEYKLPYGAPGTSENLPGTDKFTLLAKDPEKVISNAFWCKKAEEQIVLSGTYDDNNQSFSFTIAGVANNGS